MPRFFARIFPRRFQRGRVYALGILLLACSSLLFADTPGPLRAVPSGGCYCHCSESHLRGGCARICDAKRYTYRWTRTCAKPHMQTPAHHSDAGPRFPHPGRAEHAKLQK